MALEEGNDYDMNAKNSVENANAFDLIDIADLNKSGEEESDYKNQYAHLLTQKGRKSVQSHFSNQRVTKDNDSRNLINISPQDCSVEYQKDGSTTYPISTSENETKYVA